MAGFIFSGFSLDRRCLVMDVVSFGKSVPVAIGKRPGRCAGRCRKEIATIGEISERREKARYAQVVPNTAKRN